MKTAVVALSFALVLVAGAVFAEDLPAPADLVKKHLAASGGKAAMEKVKSRIDKGKLTLPDMGMEATYTAYTQPPNSLNVSDFTGSVVKNGNTDGTAWTVNPFQGNSKRPAPRPAEIFPFANLEAIVSSAKTTGEGDVGGKPATKAEFQVPGGNALTVYFDKETGLIAASESTNADGSVSRSEFSNYKKVGDLTLPHSIKQMGGAFTLQIEAETIELNAEIPAGTFDMPEEVKSLP